MFPAAIFPRAVFPEAVFPSGGSPTPSVEIDVDVFAPPQFGPFFALHAGVDLQRVNFHLEPAEDITGWEFEFRLFPSPQNSHDLLLSKTDLVVVDGESGVFSLDLTEADLDLEPTLYVYRLLRTDVEHTIVDYGHFRIHDPV